MHKVEENRAKLDRIQKEMGHIRKEWGGANVDTYEKLDSLSGEANAIKSSVMSLRTLGEQIMDYVGHFPREMRDLLRAILRSNWQTYQVLLHVQQNTSRTPTGLLDTNIRFEDALGEYKELPYEYFRYWEVWMLSSSLTSGH